MAENEDIYYDENEDYKKTAQQYVNTIHTLNETLKNIGRQIPKTVPAEEKINLLKIIANTWPIHFYHGKQYFYPPDETIKFIEDKDKKKIIKTAIVIKKIFDSDYKDPNIDVNNFKEMLDTLLIGNISYHQPGEGGSYKKKRKVKRKTKRSKGRSKRRSRRRSKRRH